MLFITLLLYDIILIRIKGDYMKKNLIKINLLLITLNFSTKNVYATTIELDNPIKIASYIICGIFIMLGIILILSGKKNSNNLAIEDKKKNEIEGLINKDEKKDEKEINFNVDSIFKTLPTFSNKNFFKEIYEQLEKEIKKVNDKTEIKILEKKIIDFQKKENKYIITSIFKIEFTDDLKEKKEQTYTIISEQQKIKSITLTNCTNCGGKIKSNNDTRCKYCHSLLPSNNNEIETWIIKDIKIDK